MSWFELREMRREGTGGLLSTCWCGMVCGLIFHPLLLYQLSPGPRERRWIIGNAYNQREQEFIWQDKREIERKKTCLDINILGPFTLSEHTSSLKTYCELISRPLKWFFRSFHWTVCVYRRYKLHIQLWATHEGDISYRYLTKQNHREDGNQAGLLLKLRFN